jgi:hypothetical protein
VWRGWFAGLLVIFLPFWLLGVVVFLIGGNWTQMPQMLGGLVALPLIAAGQGVLAGGLVLLGLKVWPPKPAQ